jgi:hypothetical protein
MSATAEEKKIKSSNHKSETERVRVQKEISKEVRRVEGERIEAEDPSKVMTKDTHGGGMSMRRVTLFVWK